MRVCCICDDVVLFKSIEEHVEQVKQNCVAEDCHIKVVFHALKFSSFFTVQGANPSSLILTMICPAG